jgi:hypothetical protein
MSWLVRYTFTPEHAPEFAWEEGQQTYEEYVESLDDMLLFLESFPEAIESFYCVHSSCSQPNLSPQMDPSSTMSVAPSADSTTEKDSPGQAAPWYGAENNLAGIALASVLFPILLAVVIQAMLYA